MADRPKPTVVSIGGNGAAPPISDASDIEALWLNPALGDGITNVSLHSVAVGKPRDFFRTVIDPAYRRRCEIYVHKPEGAAAGTAKQTTDAAAMMSLRMVFSFLSRHAPHLRV
jgi:hypothetical protein